MFSNEVRVSNNRTTDAMITRIEDYFARGCGRCARFDTADCDTRHWADGLAELRTLCLGAGLVETVKWGHPCYMHSGRNIAIIGAFRGDFRLSFFEAALLFFPFPFPRITSGVGVGRTCDR